MSQKENKPLRETDNEETYEKIIKKYSNLEDTDNRNLLKNHMLFLPMNSENLKITKNKSNLL